ncbi:MAG: hypothetical protein V2A79_15250, partial [Planctomycetota bacterium]
MRKSSRLAARRHRCAWVQGTERSRFGRCCCLAVFGVAASAAWAEAPPTADAVPEQVSERKVIEVPFDWDSVPVLQATVGSQSRSEGGLRTCPPEVVTHTDASFTGGSYTAQAGFAETEIAAASFTIPAE